MNKILFLNQMAGPMFMEMAEDISEQFPGSIVYTGHDGAFLRKQKDCLIVKRAPVYTRKSIFSRILSWIKYFGKSLLLSIKTRRQPIIFIVSNPPFLGIIGWLMNVIRKQQYVMLVYDVYPDILYAFNKDKKTFFIRLWNKCNKIIYSRASLVITIGDDMAQKIQSQVIYSRIEVIRCWADTQVIKPLDKSQNPFAKKYNLIDKKVLLYSGNMGYTHNIELLIESIDLINNSDAHFLFIGEGAKRKSVEELLIKHSGCITLLPFQPEELLPYTFPLGDIGFVTYQSGTEGCMVPSKAYYYLAAGVCLFVIGKAPNELSLTVEKFQCGRVIDSNNVKDLVRNINEVIRNPELLKRYKENARSVSEKKFSRSNTAQFLSYLNKIK